MAHRGGRLVAPRTLQVLRGDVSEEAAVRGVQLPEVSDTQDVETSERPVSSRIVKLLCADAADDIPQLQIHVSQSFALTMLTSSMLSHRHCTTRLAMSCCLCKCSSLPSPRLLTGIPQA